MDKPVIGTVKLDGWAVLAPMAGVSDLAYRVIARRFGAAMTTAEMVSAKGLYYKNKKTEDMLKIDPDEHPVALQLFGSDPEIMALGAREMAKAGPDIIDINMGCPMQKVVKNGDGSALMKNIPLAAFIVKAMAGAVDIAITVKMRLGWTRDTENCVELARAVEEAGAAAITSRRLRFRSLETGTSLTAHRLKRFWKKQDAPRLPSAVLPGEIPGCSRK